MVHQSSLTLYLNLIVLQVSLAQPFECHVSGHHFLMHQFSSVTGNDYHFSIRNISRHSDGRGYQPDKTVPTSHHQTHRVAHFSAPAQPQRHSVIERLGPQRTPRDTHDLREQLNERRSNEADRLREIEDLQRENKRLRRE